MIYGSTIGVTKGDARSLDYGSYSPEKCKEPLVPRKKTETSCSSIGNPGARRRKPQNLNPEAQVQDPKA